MNRQKLADELAGALRHARPDEPPPPGAVTSEAWRQWEIDVRAVQKALERVWGHHFQWALFWTKAHAPKEGE